MRFKWLFAISVLLSNGPLCSLATPFQPHWGNMRVKHAWDALPPDWEHLSHPDAGTVIDLYIALKPHRGNAMIDTLYEVSTPGHPKYGAHLSTEQVAELVAPHPHTLELINSWLEHHGVPSSSVSTSHGGGWLTLTGVPVSQANALLGTSYQLYQHIETKDRVLRTLSYALPAVLHGHVRTIAPTTFFGPPRTPRQTLRKRSSGEAPGKQKVLPRKHKNVTPSYLRWRYKTSSYVPSATDQNSLGIAGFVPEPSENDLEKFMSEYRIDGKDATFTRVFAGGGDPLYGGSLDESNFQIQYTQAIAYPTPHIYYTALGNTRLETWLNFMTTQQNPPKTITMSHSFDERDIELDHARAVCDLYGQLGLRGVTVLIASGDTAVGQGYCRVFVPTFPASCPYLTSVGGSYADPGDPDDDEIAADYTSGGFSNYFKRPPYQENAVQAYFQIIGNRNEGLYNASSRGFPDISAQAEMYEYIHEYETNTKWGTLCSATTAAAVISLGNDYLISIGKRPLGWLNPWLYTRGGHLGFNDITRGFNPGCNTLGFPAKVGWDPITGFGTPALDKLMEIFDSMPQDQGPDVPAL